MPERGDPFHLDRGRLRASFERASARYEAAAGLQARIGAELLERLELFRLAPGVVLDLGCGTGRVTRELKRRYPRACVIALDLAPGMLREARRHQWPWRRFERVCGDALRLPLQSGSVDLIFSNLMLQWCEPLPAALAEVRRVLTASGFFAFSTFGPDTLHELRSAWAQADGYNHVNHFSDMHEVGDALVRAGLIEPGARCRSHRGWLPGCPHVDAPPQGDRRPQRDRGALAHARRPLTPRARAASLRELPTW